MLEDAAGLRAVVPHQVLAHQPAGIRQTMRKPRGLRHQQQSRRLHTIGAHHYGLGALQYLPSCGIEINRARRAALPVDLHLSHITVGADLAASGLLRERNHRHQCARFRPHLAAEVFAEPAMRARAATVDKAAKESPPGRGRVQPQFLRRAIKQHARRFHRHRAAAGKACERGASKGFAPARPEIPRSRSALL